MERKIRVGIIGDRGIPARYSGFSTLVEELATRLVDAHEMEVTVYCRRQYFPRHPATYRGVSLVYHSAPGGKSFESLLHTQRAVRHAVGERFDLVFVVDPGNGPLIWPLTLFGTPVVLHTDGLGWLRRKWNTVQRRYYKWSEWVSARFATRLVTDAVAMQRYYRQQYRTTSTVIPYGSLVGPPPVEDAPTRFGLQRGAYYLVVARLEPENNVDVIMREYRRSRTSLPLVYVGGARFESSYSRAVLGQAGERIRCLGPIYDAAVLNGLYRDCRAYIHGHEVGGTNPSLLRAMGAGAACAAIDVPFHREVLSDRGLFFSRDRGDLARTFELLEADGDEVERLASLARDRARRLYRWDAVAAAYAALFRRVVSQPGSDWAKSRVVGRLYDPERFAEAAAAAGTDGEAVT